MGQLGTLLLVAAFFFGMKRKASANDKTNADQPGGDDEIPAPQQQPMPFLQPTLDSAMTTALPGLQPPNLNPGFDPFDPLAGLQPGISGGTTTDDETGAAISAGQLSAANYAKDYIIQQGLKRELSNVKRFYNFHKRLLRKIF